MSGAVRPELRFNTGPRFDAERRSGPSYPPAGPLGGSYGAYIARCKLGGYKGGPQRAAFWRAQGFPNLVRARAAKARKRKARLREEILEKARRITPFAPPEDVPRWAEVLGIPYRRNQRPRGF